MDIPLILASQSPRRRALLSEAGFAFKVLAPDEDAEDERRPDESPGEFVCRLARQKAENVAAKVPCGRILACDTVVVCRDRILEKPVDRADARQMLRWLRGRRQAVLSGLCLLLKTESGAIEQRETSLETTWLAMAPFSDEDIETYLDSGGWQGKAGGFGYQDRHDWLTIEEGSESNIVGLPMERLFRMLRAI